MKNEKLLAKAKDFDVCNVTISNLRIIELKSCKPSTSTVDHVSICTRCRDINVDAIHDHLALIKQQNDHIAQLSAKINEHGLENEKFKFARSMLYSGSFALNKVRQSFRRGIKFDSVSPLEANAILDARASPIIKHATSKFKFLIF